MGLGQASGSTSTSLREPSDALGSSASNPACLPRRRALAPVRAFARVSLGGDASSENTPIGVRDAPSKA
jgi:hypothetical protein